MTHFSWVGLGRMSLPREHDGLGAGIHIELAEDALLRHQACAALLLQVHLIQRQVSLCCDHFDERVLWRPRQ